MKATVFGGAMVDSIALIDNDRVERMSMRNAQSSFLLVEQGQKVEASLISQHCGGGAVNVSVALARMGYEASPVIKMGRDDRAAFIRRRLEEDSISARWILEHPNLATGSSILISSHEKDAAIFTYRGANTSLSLDDLQDEMFDADLVYVAGLSNESSECFPDIVKRAKAGGAMVVVNPGIRQLTSKMNAFIGSLANIDVLAINRKEAEALLPRLAVQFGDLKESAAAGAEDGQPSLFIEGISAAGFHLPLASYYAVLQRMGLSGLLITNGADGAYFLEGGEAVHVPAKRVEMAGSAGAGDAFVSTFAARRCLGDLPETALRLATENAACVVSHPDTQTGLLNSEELVRRSGGQ